ncbi:MAG TPA: D-alanine--D-alanine ligase family protein [Gaiellaceae bacterium]
MSRLRVAVLMGGRSSEHDISLASAGSVIEALRDRYDTVSVEIDREGRWALPAAVPPALEAHEHDRKPVETLPVPAESSVPATLADVDVVFPVLHGPFGEDGTVQGLLELAGVPYVGPGVLSSALCMDKDVFKAVLRDRGVPVTSSVTLRDGDPVEHPFSYPVFIKPARLGSSVGISKVHGRSELGPALALAFRHDEKVLIEEFVDGLEVECGVLGNRDPIASQPGQIIAHAEWYDFSAKYEEGGMELIVPPPISAEAIERVRKLAVEAFIAGECEGMARVDFFVRRSGGSDEVLVNELNTIPGFTSTSVYAKLFAESGIPYSELLDRLITLALERHERQQRYAY